MENEKIAALVLALMVAGILSAYLALQNWDDISDNLTETTEPVDVIEYGDCVDLNYILKYASNDTFIESSYADWQNRSDGTLFKIFVSQNESEIPPSDYEVNYSQKMQDGMFVKGFIEGLVGLKEGETETFTIESEDAYGIRVKEGVNFSSKRVSPYLTQTFTVTNVTGDDITFKWIDLPDDNFTMPQGYLKENLVARDLDFYYGSPYKNIPPYFLWADSSKIINTSTETVKILTTPNKSKNLTEQPQMFAVGEKTSIILPDITTASWNDSKITISTNPDLNYTYDIYSQGQTLTLEVSNVTDNNFTLTYDQATEPFIINKTIVFDRVYSYKRIYSIPISINDVNLGQIPVALTFLESDLKEEGYSIHELAGETLKYEVTIEEIYKTSK
jgi:FKBP-type peptidyl-prolyl cis-trans isomerase 2